MAIIKKSSIREKCLGVEDAATNLSITLNDECEKMSKYDGLFLSTEGALAELKHTLKDFKEQQLLLYIKNGNIPVYIKHNEIEHLIDNEVYQVAEATNILHAPMYKYSQLSESYYSDLYIDEDSNIVISGDVVHVLSVETVSKADNKVNLNDILNLSTLGYSDSLLVHLNFDELQNFAKNVLLSSAALTVKKDNSSGELHKELLFGSSDNPLSWGVRKRQRMDSISFEINAILLKALDEGLDSPPTINEVLHQLFQHDIYIGMMDDGSHKFRCSGGEYKTLKPKALKNRVSEIVVKHIN